MNLKTKVLFLSISTTTFVVGGSSCMCSTLSFGAAEAAAACCTFLATTAGSGSAACVELGPLIFIEAPLHPITSGGAVSPHQKRRFGRYCNSFRTAPCNWFDCCNADI